MRYVSGFNCMKHLYVANVLQVFIMSQYGQYSLLYEHLRIFFTETYFKGSTTAFALVCVFKWSYWEVCVCMRVSEREWEREKLMFHEWMSFDHILLLSQAKKIEMKQFGFFYSKEKVFHSTVALNSFFSLHDELSKKLLS